MPRSRRLSIDEVDQSASEAVRSLERYVRAGDLEPTLLELVRIRASQLNGCAYCLDVHLHDARVAGENQRRLDLLSEWREVPELFTAREAAALELTEAVTRISVAGVPDQVWDVVARQFAEEQVVRLLLAIATINVWNRLAVSVQQALPKRT